MASGGARVVGVREEVDGGGWHVDKGVCGEGCCGRGISCNVMIIGFPYSSTCGYHDSFPT
eukprot:8694737-Prorocentrum_lima.AAC.1